MKKVLLVSLALVLAFLFVSCANEGDGEFAVSYNGSGVGYDFLTNELIGYKNSMLQSYGLDEDIDVLWEMDSGEEGVNNADAIKNLAIKECAAVAFILDYNKKNSIVLSDEDKAKIEEDLKTLEDSFESHDKYVEYIGKVGFDEESMRETSEIMLLYQRGVEHITSSDGEYAVTDKAVDDYIKENFVAVKHVYINTVAEFDAELQQYVQISAETLEKQNDKIKLIEDGLNKGDSFDMLYTFSDDGMQTAFPDGMAITYGNVASIDYENACFSLEVGEWGRFDIADYGTYFIKRVEIPESEMETSRESALFLLRSNVIADIWEKHEKEFKIDKKYIEELDVKSLYVFE